MTRKTMWIAGALILAIGAFAYLSVHQAPAGKEAAGTIVEAQRAISENKLSPAQSTADAAPDQKAFKSSADSSETSEKMRAGVMNRVLNDVVDGPGWSSCTSGACPSPSPR